MDTMDITDIDLSYQNLPMTDVVASFKAIDKTTTMHLAWWIQYLDISAEAHIQGMGRYGQYILFTHNQVKGPGYFGIADSAKLTFRHTSVNPPEGYHHPGGFQVIGDFAAVGIDETEKSKKPSCVYIYDLKPLKTGGNPTRLDFSYILRPNGGAAAVGITYANNRYVLAVYSSPDTKVYIYQSNANYKLGDPQLTWEYLFDFTVLVDDKSVGYDNLNLITDKDGTVYMIGLRAKDDTKDYTELVKIDIAQKIATLIESVHVTIKNTSIAGAHFRYGAGTWWQDMDSIEMFCCGRSFTTYGTQLATFKESKDTTQLWRTSLPKSGYEAVSVVAENGYACAGSNGYVYRLDKENGSVIATNELPGHGKHDVRLSLIYSTLLVGTDGSVLALDANTLATKWDTPLIGTEDKPVSIDTYGNILCVGSHGYVYQLDLQTGAILHKNDLPGTGKNDVRLAMTAGFCFVGTNGYLFSIRTFDFETLWKVNLGVGGHITDVVSGAGCVYAGCNGYIYKYNSANGAKQAENSMPEQGKHQIRLALMDNYLYVGMNGFVYCLDATTLNQYWRYSLPDSGYELVNLSAHDGKLFAGSNGYFYQLTPGPSDPVLLHKGDLAGLKKHEVRLSHEGSFVCVGTYGFALGFKADSL